MENFLMNWKNYLYGMWLGGSVAICFNTGVLDWRFWAVMLPTVALVTLVNERRGDS